MNRTLRSGVSLLALSLLGLLSGCQTTKPYDYTNFRAHPPRSIFVIPPLNESTTLEGTYSYLSTVSRPIAERGYYVFPVAVVDQFLKDNGLPTTGEMNQLPPAKVGEITGADAVMYLDLKQYASKFVVINSVTTVEVFAKLIDTRTGTLLWQGRGFAQQSGGGSGNLLADLIAAAIAQVINNKTDTAHNVSRLANNTLFLPENTGLPYGPYSPKYDRSHYGCQSNSRNCVVPLSGSGQYPTASRNRSFTQPGSGWLTAGRSRPSDLRIHSTAKPTYSWRLGAEHGFRSGPEPALARPLPPGASAPDADFGPIKLPCASRDIRYAFPKPTAVDRPPELRSCRNHRTTPSRFCYSSGHSLQAPTS